MPGIADYGAFCAAIIVFLALPGPSFRAGVAATLGVVGGCVLGFGIRLDVQ